MASSKHIARGSRYDYTGRKVNHLIFLRYARPGGTGVGAIWQLRCDCGAVTEKSARDVNGQRVKTCGKCEYHRELVGRRPPQERRSHGLVKRAFLRELNRASQDGAGFDFSNQDFMRFYSSACQGCGEPSRGGMIRISSDQSYTPSNCLPLCNGCRRRLASHSLHEAVSFWVGFLPKLGFPIGTKAS